MIDINEYKDDYDVTEQISLFYKNKELVISKLKKWQEKTLSSNALLYICNELFEKYYFTVESLLNAEPEVFDYIYGLCISTLDCLITVGETSIFIDEAEEFFEIFEIFEIKFVYDYFENTRKNMIFAQTEFSNVMH